MSFGPSAERTPAALACRLAQGHRPPPRAAADEAGRERELPERPPRPLGPREQPVEQRAERPAQGELVRDRLGEGERLDQLCRRRSPAHAPALPAACEAPRPLPLLTQPLGHRAARQGGEGPEGADAETLELGVPLLLERQERERERLEKRSLLLPLDDHRLSRARHARRREGDEAALPRACARVPGRPDGGERLRERRLHPSVEPLDAAGLEHDHARLDRLHTEPRVLEATQDSLPLPLGARGIRVDEHELGAGRERLAEAHPAVTPAASAAAVTGPSSGSLPGSGASAAGTTASLGRDRSATRSSNPGMRRQAIIGNTCSIRTRVPLQGRFEERSVERCGRARPRRAEALGHVRHRQLAVRRHGTSNSASTRSSTGRRSSSGSIAHSLRERTSSSRSAPVRAAGRARTSACSTGP